MSTAVKTTDTELIIERIFDAPRDLVFEVWSDVKHIEQWWGPTGFTTTTKGEMTMKPGGSWTFTMHGPDGRDYPNRIIFIEVIKPEKLVYKHSGDEDTEPVNFHVTVTFEAIAARKTKLTMRSVFEFAADFERVRREYGAVEGAVQMVERLTEYLVDQQKVHTSNA